MSRHHDVLAIGNAILDIIGRCDAACLNALGMAKGRMSLVGSSARIAAIRDKLGPCIELSGGSAANAAVGVASLGGRAAFIGRVAEDDCGRIFRHDIRGIGVEFIAMPSLLAGKETSRSIILVSPDGARTMNTFLGCSSELDYRAIDSKTIDAASIVLLEGYLFDVAEARAALYRADSLAKASSKTVALKLPDSLCINRHRRELLDFVRSGIQLLIGNESEILSLYRANSFDEAVKQAKRDVPLAALTRSAKGSVIVCRGNCLFIPPEPVRTVVDMTGAGDFYTAGLLFGLSQGMSAMDSGRLGSFAASEIICNYGARPKSNLGHLARLRGLLN